MELSDLVRYVVDKFQSAHGYSEFDMKETSKKFESYLTQEFRQRLELAIYHLEKEEERFGFSDKKRHIEEYAKVERAIIYKAKELAAVSKEDLEELSRL